MDSNLFLFIFLALGLVFISGCVQSMGNVTNNTGEVNDTKSIVYMRGVNKTEENVDNNSVSANVSDNSAKYTYSGTFTDNGNSICMIDGKPVIRLYSTTWCPHCNWIKSTFDAFAKEYVDAGKIVAYHWNVDAKDDTLTDVIETNVPTEEMQYVSQGNPGGYVPFYVFGCKYTRVGNAYESSGDLAKEDNEFRALTEKIIAESKG
jgi:thiol-disulfide isomerase/thioredoxin